MGRILPICPRCGVKNVDTQGLGNFGFQPPQKPNKSWLLLKCNNGDCLGLVLFEEDSANPSESGAVYPLADSDLDDGSLCPAEVRSDFREAATTYQVRCPKASIAMGRRTLQRVLKEQGCTAHKLVDAIDEGLKKGIIRDVYKALVDEIRHYGNFSAHPDDDQLDNVTLDNAANLLELLRLLIYDIYVVPAKVASLNAQRLAARGRP